MCSSPTLAVDALDVEVAVDTLDADAADEDAAVEVKLEERLTAGESAGLSPPSLWLSMPSATSSVFNAAITIPEPTHKSSSHGAWHCAACGQG